MFASLFWSLRNIALPITNKKTAWTCDRTRRQPATAIIAINTTTTLDSFGLLDPPFSVPPHTQNIAGGKISGFERKAFTRQNFPDSKVFGFKAPTLDSGFKISGDMTKPGCFHFGFVLSCVNGKTNPVLKAAKYEIQKHSTCRATLFRFKFSSMFPVFHLA